MNAMTRNRLSCLVRDGILTVVVCLSLGFGGMMFFPVYDTSVPGVCMLSGMGTFSLLFCGFGLGVFVCVLPLALALRGTCHVCAD